MIEGSFPYHYVFSADKKLYIHKDILKEFEKVDKTPGNRIGLVPVIVNEPLCAIWGYRSIGDYRYNPLYNNNDPCEVISRSLSFLEEMGIRFY